MLRLASARPWWLVLCVLWMFLPGCALWPSPAPEAGGDSGALVSEQGLLAFTLEIEAPAPLDALLERHLELRRYRNLTDVQPSELARLLHSADADVAQLLATQGYFSPDITISSSPAPQGSEAPRQVHIQVTPGPQTLVQEVQINVTGAAAHDVGSTRRVQKWHTDWPLPTGAVFTQSAWDSAKALLLRRLQERDYPAARLLQSHADIDTQTHQAHLSVLYDSGPAYYFGPLHIQGGTRYDTDGARRIARLPSGARYSDVQLLDAQQRLAASGYYDSVFLTLDTDNGPPEAAAVVAQVREAPLHKITVGAGISTDSGARLSLQHVHHRLPWLGWRATSNINLERDTQQMDSEWVSLPDERGWRWFGAGQYKREITGSYPVNNTRWRVGQAQASTFIDRNFYLQLDTASPQGAGAPDPGAALSANFGWTGRYFNHHTNPTKGYGMAFELGAGSTLRGQRDPFVRVLGRWQSFIPLGKVTLQGDEGTSVQRNSRLQLRGEGAMVLSAQDANVPTSQLLMTGGDTSVRGYAYRSIGARTDSGTLYGGRYLLVASAEWQRPLTLRGDATHWESAVFLDAGAVSNELHALRARVGVGAGLRWRSPVGPLQTDLAWGVQEQRLRLHLRLGFSF